VQKQEKSYVPNEKAAITVARFFQRMDAVLTEKTAIVADVGDSLFGASDLTVHNSMQFLSPAFYTSMGFAVPGCLGVMTARPDLQTIVFVGDGAFHMTGMEGSTLVRRGLKPKIFVLNNEGYGTERKLLEGPWNDIQNWNYEKLPDVWGGGKGYIVRTEGDLEMVLAEVISSDELCIVNVKIAKNDASPALSRFTAKLKRKV